MLYKHLMCIYGCSWVRPTRTWSWSSHFGSSFDYNLGPFNVWVSLGLIHRKPEGWLGWIWIISAYYVAIILSKHIARKLVQMKRLFHPGPICYIGGLGLDMGCVPKVGWICLSPDQIWPMNIPYVYWLIHIGDTTNTRIANGYLIIRGSEFLSFK